ncbi:MAG: hypothetical protein JO072_01160 [Parafilimonas sp.]|nr:hypothetical protein [Parafilimonas sp.]
MNKLIYPIFLMFLSCMNDNSLKYNTYEKWSLPEEFENSYLKDNPKQVKETLYISKNDSTLNVSGQLNNYDTWKFDNNGNIIFHEFSTLSDSFWIITKYDFNDDGLQSITYSSSTSDKKDDTSKTIIKKKTDNFLEIKTGLDKPRYSIISFLNDGKTRKQEFIPDTNKFTDILATQIYNYDKGMIQKNELMTNDGIHKMIRYFYSKEKYLDSIVSYDSDTVTTKEFFYNNQFGDPVKYYELDSKNDTTSIATMKYEYDQHNNWIKKLVKEEDKSIYAGLIDVLKSKSQYSLLVREIKY